jgi:hypothetical protein
MSRRSQTSTAMVSKTITTPRATVRPMSAKKRLSAAPRAKSITRMPLIELAGSWQV